MFLIRGIQLTLLFLNNLTIEYIEDLAHFMFLAVERVWAGVYEKRSALDGQGIEKCWKAIMSALAELGDGLS
jgi:hypothetical protein